MTFVMKGILCVAGAVMLMSIIMMISVLWDEKKDKKREDERIDTTIAGS